MVVLPDEGGHDVLLGVAGHVLIEAILGHSQLTYWTRLLITITNGGHLYYYNKDVYFIYPPSSKARRQAVSSSFFISPSLSYVCTAVSQTVKSVTPVQEERKECCMTQCYTCLEHASLFEHEQ